MITPDVRAFSQLARKGNLVAVTETIPADLETPVSSFLKIAGHEKNAFLLESAEQEEHIGRYSILGIHPDVLIGADAEGALFEETGGKARKLIGFKTLADAVESRMKDFRLANPEDLKGFSGGFVGFLSYENVAGFDDVRLKALPSISVPRGIFVFCTDLVVFDHFRKQLHFIALVRSSKNASSAHREGVRRIEAMIARLNRPLKPVKAAKKPLSAVPKSHIKPEVFESKVKKIKEYIRAGDCIQVVLSQRFSLPFEGEDFQIYRALRSINPSPYMFYFRCGGLRLIGSSPEVLVKKTGALAEVRPIAGTRPRGASVKEDLRHEENLRKSKKELAEHLMLVDLGRNDLGRVCRFDSIKVENFARVERYSHVMHLVSDVSGVLKPGKTAFDLLKATFPAGTVSGAPKIRAMEIINEMETEERGPYAGCLGYFGLNGDMDMCITIRTMVLNKGRLYLQAGAGIVKDSNPASEYQETVNKAKALFKAIEEQGRFPCFS